MGKKILAINPQETAEYKMPTMVYFGRGAVKGLPEIVKKLGSVSVLLVTGSHFKVQPEFEQIRQDLRGVPDVVIYEAVIRKSDYTTINNLTAFCRQHNFDTIIAIGGGTIIDCAKCAVILSVHQGLVEDYVANKTRALSRKGISLIAIPTTAGTGSEVTPWATVWGDDSKKYSLSSSKFMFPDIAIIDPKLTDSLNPETTAETGMDALSQAIEAYWNVNHNSVSDKYALKAIGKIISNIEITVKDPSEKSRDEMSRGALFSGLSFSNTQTTICHSISYPMTTHWGIPHGQAVSITLPAFIEYTLPIMEGKRRKELLIAIRSHSEKEAAEKIKRLMIRIGLKTRISELGIPQDQLNLIVSEGFHPDRAKNAPRIPTGEELREMLLNIY